jgi:hypothetical protein
MNLFHYFRDRRAIERRLNQQTRWQPGCPEGAHQTITRQLTPGGGHFEHRCVGCQKLIGLEYVGQIEPKKKTGPKVAA